MKTILEILFWAIYMYIIGFFWFGISMIAIAIEYHFKFKETCKFALECAIWSWLGIWKMMRGYLEIKIKAHENNEQK